MRRLGLLAVALAGAALLTAAAPAFNWRLPRDVIAPHVPADNPMSEAKVELGRRLFYDADLSIDGTMSCATCHEQHRGFAEGNATHPGVKGQAGKRNVMGLTNVAYVSPLTWADPQTVTLEGQVATPVFGDHPVEMGMAGQKGELVRRLAADACYRRQFAQAFPEKPAVDLGNIDKAVAAFERTLVSFNAPYDQAVTGRPDRMSAAAWRGSALFETRGCQACHEGPAFSDSAFHDIGLPQAARDAGLIEKTGKAGDANRFRTPGLRNVALTGPFMHDGSVKTLKEAVLAHGKIAPVSAEEAQDLTAFLEALTDMDFIKAERFSLPKRFCGKKR